MAISVDNATGDKEYIKSFDRNKAESYSLNDLIKILISKGVLSESDFA